MEFLIIISAALLGSLIGQVRPVRNYLDGLEQAAKRAAVHTHFEKTHGGSAE